MLVSQFSRQENFDKLERWELDFADVYEAIHLPETPHHRQQTTSESLRAKYSEFPAEKCDSSTKPVSVLHNQAIYYYPACQTASC